MFLKKKVNSCCKDCPLLLEKDKEIQRLKNGLNLVKSKISDIRIQLTDERGREL